MDRQTFVIKTSPSDDITDPEALQSITKKPRMANKEKNIDVGTDPLSRLPEHIVHQIMSLLPMEDSTSMGILSKSLLSMWRSFPIIDFDFDLVWYKSRFAVTMDLFANFVSDSLEGRALKSDLEKLNLRASLTDRRDLLEKLVKFAIKNNVRDISLRSVQCGLPEEVFSMKSVKRMLLSDIKLDRANIILNSPLIENFSIIDCTSEKGSVVEFCSPQLKTAEFENWRGLKRVKMDGAKSLEYFSFSGLVEEDCEIVNLGSCKSLKTLKLSTTRGVTDKWFEEVVSQFDLLENLELACCVGLKNVVICNKRLKTIVLKDCYPFTLEKVDVGVVNLEVFRYSKESGSTRRQCKINLRRCTNLKDLQLIDASVDVTDGWTEETISEGGFRLLENLKLKRCQLLKEIKFDSEHLKRLELLSCEKLEIAEVKAPNLVSLVYSGPVLPSAVVTSCNVDAELHVDYLRQHYCHKGMRDFISNFGIYKRLTLTCSNQVYLIYPSETRDTLISPLLDLRHLNAKLTNNDVGNLVELIDGLLWLAAHPETISITVASKLHAKFKFSYNPSLKRKEEQAVDNITSCCVSSPVKCWRHDLESVKMEICERFVESDSLQDFFTKNAKNPINTCIDKIN